MDPTAAPGVPFSRVRFAAAAPLACAVLAACALLAAPLAAQDRPREDPATLIRDVIFEGNDELSDGELQERIVTLPTRCRGFLLQPFCWLTDWHLITHREYLDRDEVRRDELRLEVHYFRQGYRQARAASEVRERDDGVEVVFHLFEGEPTRIARREVEQHGDGLPGRRIRRADVLEEGDRLDLDRLEESLEYLHLHLGEAGYLDAVVEDSIVVRGLEADLRVDIRPGPQSTVGDITVEGNEQVDDQTVREGLRLRQGRVLRTHHLRSSQRSLYESNLFYEARVGVPAQDDSVKTVVVQVREAPPRRAEVGGGFNTLEFFQVEGVFTHFNWLGGGRRLELRATVGNLLAGQLQGKGLFQSVVPSEFAAIDEAPFLRPTWNASVEYRQPGFVAATDVVAVSGFAQRRTIPAVVVEQSFGGTVSLIRQFTFRTPLSLSYRYEQTSVEGGDLYFCINHGVCEPSTIDAVRGFNSISPAVLSFHSDQSNDPLAPSRGYRVRVELEHASAYTVSDFRYNRASGAATYYLPFDLHETRVLAGRLRAGWVGPLASTAEAIGIEGFDERLLHPRKRFYSGGSRSVRGYWENQLGPRVLTISPTALEEGGCTPATIADGSCDPAGADPTTFRPRPTGGTTVLEGSVEYRFPLFGQLSGAVFVDGGIVGDRIGRLFTGEGVWAVTPGFGARYPTPIGPVRIDLGIRPATPEWLDVVTQVRGDNGLPELIRLDQQYLYDPIEAAGGGGFIRQVLARLRLHVSIGEAL